MQPAKYWRPNLITVVGCGTIGISWSAYFASRGLPVIAFDPNPKRREAFMPAMARILSSLPDTHVVMPRVAQDQAEALANADLVVENAAERIELKRDLIRELQSLAPSGSLLVSSTSSFTHSEITSKTEDPRRVLIAHPYNPPHLIPLVELFGIEPKYVEQLRSFYQGIGKEPIVMKREMTGHVANRLSAALWREAIYLLQEGVASVEDIDKAITAGPGLRWAINGPFMTYNLGGGPGGIRHYMEHLGPSQQSRWASLGEPDVTPELIEQIVSGVEHARHGLSQQQLEDYRDQMIRAITRVTQINENLEPDNGP